MPGIPRFATQTSMNPRHRVENKVVCFLLLFRPIFFLGQCTLYVCPYFDDYFSLKLLPCASLCLRHIVQPASWGRKPSSWLFPPTPPDLFSHVLKNSYLSSIGKGTFRIETSPFLYCRRGISPFFQTDVIASINFQLAIISSVLTKSV